MICDDLDGSCPAFLRMVAQQNVCAGDDHERLGCITQTTEDSAQSTKQNAPAFSVFQQDAKARKCCDAV